MTRSLALTNSMPLPLLSFSPTWVADPSVDNCRTTAGETIEKRKTQEHPGMVKSMSIEEHTTARQAVVGGTRATLQQAQRGFIVCMVESGLRGIERVYRFGCRFGELASLWSLGRPAGCDPIVADRG